jgi:hypothetical protein
MNVIPMMSEVLNITNPMIRETALPNFRLAPDQGAERMGIPSFDQLERALDGHVARRGKQEMNVIRHECEGVQGVLTFATVVEEKSLKKQSCVILDLKQSSTIPCREGDEIGSWRRKES